MHPLRSFWTNLRERRALLGVLARRPQLLLYLPVVHHDFIRLWDDDAYVTDNVHVRTGLKLTNYPGRLRALSNRTGIR